MALGMYLRRFPANVPTPTAAEQVPLPEFLRTRDWLTKAEVTITGGDENWLAGRLTGTLNLRGEAAGKKQKAGARKTDGGQTICAFYAIEQRANRGVAFMVTNGFCNYAHMDKFERVNEERANKNEGAEVKVAGKRSSGGSGEGTRKKRQRNG